MMRSSLRGATALLWITALVGPVVAQQEPAADESEVVEPMPAEPVPAEPVPAEPVPAEPVPAESPTFAPETEPGRVAEPDPAPRFEPALDPNFTAPRAYIDGIEVRSPARTRLTEVMLVGLEEEQNDFRWRTPVLTNGVLLPRAVDPDEAYVQRLRLYADGADDDELWDDGVPEAAQPMILTPQRAAAVSSALPWLLGTGLSILVALGWRRRMATVESEAAAQRRLARQRAR